MRTPRPRHPSLLLRLLIGPLLALTTACATIDEREQMLRTQEWADLYLRAHRNRIAAAADSFRERARFPRVMKLPEGTVILSRGELLGPLQDEFLRLRVTYLNDTASTYDRICLGFAAIDGTGRVHGRKDVEFVLPLDHRFTPGNSHTETVHVPTGGAHEMLGFDVQVELSAQTL